MNKDSFVRWRFLCIIRHIIIICVCIGTCDAPRDDSYNTFMYIYYLYITGKKRIAKTAAAGFLGSHDLCRRRSSPLVRYREEATI